METSGHVWDLQNLARAHRLVDWTVDRVLRDARGSVAEVGAGIGTYSERLLRRDVTELLLIEPDPECSAALRTRFAGDPRVEVAEDELPGSPALDARAGRVDRVVSQNVVEHIDDDAGAIEAMARALRPGGVLTLQVPAHPWLYGELDRRYEHCRRYTREGLTRVLEGAGLEVRELEAFNLLGVLGWLARRRRAGAGIDPRSLRAYEALVRVWRPVEDRLRPPWGLSWVAHARRPS